VPAHHNLPSRPDTRSSMRPAPHPGLVPARTAPGRVWQAPRTRRIAGRPVNADGSGGIGGAARGELAARRLRQCPSLPGGLGTRRSAGTLKGRFPVVVFGRENRRQQVAAGHTRHRAYRLDLSSGNELVVVAARWWQAMHTLPRNSTGRAVADYVVRRGWHYAFVVEPDAE